LINISLTVIQWIFVLYFLSKALIVATKKLGSKGMDCHTSITTYAQPHLTRNNRCAKFPSAWSGSPSM